MRCIDRLGTSGNPFSIAGTDKGGRKAPEGVAMTRHLSIGYAYPLSKRAWLYADASDERAEISVRHLDSGIRASF